MEGARGLASPSRPQGRAQDREANQRGPARAGSPGETLCFNYLPPRAPDPFEAFRPSRGIPRFICQQPRLLRGRTLGTAKKQQTQLGCANTAYGFVLASLPHPHPPTRRLGRREEAEPGVGTRVGEGKRRRTNNFCPELFT